jgi:hypothetical protein
MALPGAYAPASIALRVTRARKPPLHNKAAVLEEVTIALLLIILLGAEFFLGFSKESQLLPSPSVKKVTRCSLQFMHDFLTSAIAYKIYFATVYQVWRLFSLD